MSDKGEPELFVGSHIPEDAPPESLPFYGAQIAMQEMVSAMTSYEINGRPALSHDLVMQSLAMGIALMITGQPKDRTPRDVRLDAEKWGKVIASFARGLHESGSEYSRNVLGLLGIEQVSTTIN